MKGLLKLLSLLLLLPFFLLACTKDNEKQDEIPPAKTFAFIETALGDYYTTDITPISFDFSDDQIYIPDEDMTVSIFENDFTFVGTLKNVGNVPLKAYTIRFKGASGFFIHNQNLRYIRCYDENLHREGELNNLPQLNNEFISGIDRDLFDNLFLIYDHNTIHKYSSDLSGPIATNSSISDLFEHGTYDFEIMAICIDNNQNVYISINVHDEQSEGMDAVLKFDNDLNFIKAIGGDWLFNGPHGIAFDKNNYMYVVNRYHSVVKVFNSNMELVTMSGELDVSGDADGLLDEPIGIGINNNKVYVSEKENHRVSVFTTYR